MLNWTIDGSDAAPAALGAVTATEYYRHGQPFYAARVRRPRPVGLPVPVLLGDYLLEMVGVPACSGIQREVSAGVSQGPRTGRDCGRQRAVPSGAASRGFRLRL